MILLYLMILLCGILINTNTNVWNQLHYREREERENVCEECFNR